MLFKLLIRLFGEEEISIPLPYHPGEHTRFIKLKETGFMSKVFNFFGIGGMTIADVVFVKPVTYDVKVRQAYREAEKKSKFILHEQEHHRQLLDYSNGHWGLHVMKYIGKYIKIYFARPKLHAYYDHPYEREARRTANQVDPYPWKEEGKNRWLPFFIG